MKRLLASCFGLGRLPIAPGTWGSLPPTIVFAVLCYLQASVMLLAIVMAVLVVVGCVVCVKCGPVIIAAAGKEDPGEVVADEFAGQALTFLVGGLLGCGRTWLIAVGGFLVFRLFDIVKPPPARRLEKLPAGWGVLADDLLAGLYAGIVLLICITLCIS